MALSVSTNEEKMGQAYNYISFLGNKDLEQIVCEIERRFNVFRVNNPNGFSKESIGSIFYGLSQSEFFQASDISDVTKNLHISYFGASESEFISGSMIPTDFQDYLTFSLAKVDPHVIVINDFNTTQNEYGKYFSCCEDALNGKFNIVSEYDAIEDQSGTGKGLQTMHKKLIHALHKRAPWSKKTLVI